MKASVWSIKGFLPYIVVVFLNAFTDLGHKIIIQNTIFKIYDGQTQIILTAIVNALILLPFILLFSPSGFLSDRYPKSKIMRLFAGVAVVITLFITLCYYLGLFELAFAFTFLLALQSAIYSPAKYGYIKELVGEKFITMGNGVVQAVTTTSILGGILIYSILFESYLADKSYTTSKEILQYIAPLGWLLILGSLIEFVLAYRLPNTHIESNKRFHLPSYFQGVYLKSNLKLLHKNRTIFLSILGLSLFWGISQVVLSSFPEYAKDTLNITNTVLVQGMMAIAGIGIVIGSIVAGRVSRYYIEVGAVPLGAVGLSFSLLLLPMIEDPLWHMINFFAFGLFAGLFIVPLNALIQYHSREHELGMILAGNNFAQNVVMFTFLMMTVAFALLGIKSVGLFYIMLLFSGVATLYLIRGMLSELLKFIVFMIASLLYSVKVINSKNLPSTGGVLLLGNHISWIDWIVLQMATDRPIRFVMERSMYSRWYLKPFFALFGAIPISPRGMKQAKLDVERLLREGEVVCLFPEGAISRNGHLGEFKRGFEKMVGESEALIVPFYLQGLWGDRFSRASKHFKRRRSKSRTTVIINFGQPLPPNTKAPTIKMRLNELSYQAWLEYANTLPSLAQAWLESAKRYSTSICCQEFNGRKYSYSKMLSSSLLYAKRVEQKPKRVALLLPPSIDASKMILAFVMSKQEFIPLNHNLPKEQFDTVMALAQIEMIYTSKRYLAQLKSMGIDIDTLLKESDIRFIDDIEQSISRVERYWYRVTVKLLPKVPLQALYLSKTDNRDVALSIATRGEYAKTKIVQLTHQNIMANAEQLHDMLNCKEDDLLLSTLPLYHAYGLIVNTLSPLLIGLPLGFVPNPRDAKAVGRATLRYRATILASTPPLWELYSQSRAIGPLMFASLRILLSGGATLTEEIERSFEQKFHKQILEGYGTTESAPLASANIADIIESNEFTIHQGHKRGTVGMALQGTAFRVVDPDTLESLGIDEVGLILIGGAQVMQGYLNNPQITQSLIIEIDGLRWFKSGDMGSLDSDGFLTIDR